MIDLTSKLTLLIEKDPIVSTFDSKAIISQPNEVITSYNRHAGTYVAFDLLRDLEERFIDKIIKSQSPKACLVARYGYGKTTAAIGLWQACNKAGILAIPPAGYTSIADIASAVYSWAQTVLDKNPKALVKLRELHTTYLQSSTEELAKLVSKRSGRPYEQVMEVLTDPALEGSLRLDPPTTNIVLFLETLTHIVTANGYVGIAIFVDEFQQLLGKAGADILTALRSLVWGLRTRKIPLGLAITMDPNSESILGERAGDILHRIKDDDLYLDFRQIHNTEFPKLLWERYARRLDLNGLTFRIVDKPTLEALGQICDRADLSNGPRTVANTFRSIASYYSDTERTYTPIQLIDDFITGSIIFDGDANTIASLVTEFSGYAYFKRSDAHLAVLKLLAAFPAGCPPEIAERYGLLDTFQQITSELRGDIVTLLPSGYALIDLQRVGKPLNKLSLILKKYWMQITNTETEPAENIRRFATYVLPLLFPIGTSQVESWSAESTLSLTTDNAYTQTFVGRLHSHHPLRRIRALVCTEVPSFNQDDGTVDINLIFVLNNDSTGEQKAHSQQNNCLIFFLNIGRAPQEGLPPDLRIVEHNLSPQPSTPAVLLNVIEFVEREISSTTLKQSEQAQVNHTLESVRRWFLNFTFDEHLLGSIDLEAATPGYRGIRDLLFRECERRFPSYSTLITSTIWRDNLALYQKVLSERSLAERRGIEPVKGTKTQIAALFGQRNHAGFDSKMRVQYPSLLNIIWTGEQAELLFTPHPAETRVLTFVGDEGCLYDNVINHCRADGYAREEIEEIFALLVTRGQIKEETGKIHKVDIVSAAELRRLGAEFVTELNTLKAVLPLEVLVKELEIAQSLATTDADDEIAHQRAYTQLVSLTEKIAILRTRARLAFLDLLEQQKGEIVALLQSLEKPIPGCSAAVSFKNHLDGARKLLEENAISIRRIGVRLRETVQATRNKVTIAQDLEIGHLLGEEAEALRQSNETLLDLKKRATFYTQKSEQLKQWAAWVDYFVRLRHNISKLVVQLDSVESVVVRLAGILNEIESDVRELLSNQGLVALEKIQEVQHRLDEVAREYDRSLTERETAFEKEKTHLETMIASIINDKKSLRGKYQVSKHDESYQDLYTEFLQIVQEALHHFMRRIKLLEIRIRDTEKLKIKGQSTATDRKTIKTIIRQITECEENLSSHQLLSVVSSDTWYKDLLEKILQIKVRIDEVETRLPTQTMLPITTEIVLSKLTSNQQDLRDVIDLEACIAALPAESEFAALLQLYLSGKIVLKIWVEDNLNCR